MRKYFFIMICLLFSLYSFGQKPKTGTYTYQYYDLEYKQKIAPCKIVIKKDSIAVYASKELAQRLTNLKEGALIEKGLLIKHRSGKWIIGTENQDAPNPALNPEEQSYIDSGKKIYYTF